MNILIKCVYELKEDIKNHELKLDDQEIYNKLIAKLSDGYDLSEEFIKTVFKTDDLLPFVRKSLEDEL